MSVRFRANNHPQQIRTRGVRPDIDDRATPPELYEPLAARFGFTLDAAALPHNAQCARYFTPAEDGLSQSWAGERVWCNPPYSAIQPWIAKAWTEAATAPLIVMLLPANRTEQTWWQTLVEPFRDNGRGLRVEFIAGRQRFVGPQTFVDLFGRPRGHGEKPPFGVCLLIWERGA